MKLFGIMLALAFLAVPVMGDDLVNISLDASGSCADDADYITIDIIATSDHDDLGVEFAGIQLLTYYNPSSLSLWGYSPGEYSWFIPDPFINDGQDINQNLEDGEVIAVFFGDFLNPPRTPMLVGSLIFEVLDGTDNCVYIDKIYPYNPVVMTRVSSSLGEVTGELLNDCADDCTDIPFKITEVVEVPEMSKGVDVQKKQKP